MLDKRDSNIYGDVSLAEVNNQLEKIASKDNFLIAFFQSNHEGEIIDYIQDNFGEWNGLIINPAGLTHTSVVLRDVLEILQIPIVEVHLSNIYAREKFREKSLIRDIVDGHISGLGVYGYKAALNYLINIIKKGETA